MSRFIHPFSRRTFLGLAASALASRAAAVPVLDDLSPDTPAGNIDGGASTAGLTLAVAGSEAALYAVSLNAGVWKSVLGGAWRQLPLSPPLACSIAVDPANAARLAVGERNGDSVDVRLNSAGAWESQDAGSTWRRILDPLSIPGCTSQAVPALSYTRRGTLLVGTQSGIGRRPLRGAHVDFSHSPPHLGLVTAFAVGEHRLWARTRDSLLFSDDDGRSWQARPIPTRLPGVDAPLTSHGRGTAFALAGFDNVAFLLVKPDPDSTGNRNTILIYRPDGDRWLLQLLSSGDGTGLGGRRFLKSYVLNSQALPPGLGGRLQLLFGAGQEIQQALGWNSDGAPRWDRSVQTDWAGPVHDTRHLHSDLWDVHLPPDYNPPHQLTAWAAGDGGVFCAVAPEVTGPSYAGALYQAKWITASAGLHTHHIHTLTVLPVPGSPSRLAYATSDNDAWFTNPTALSDAATWDHEGYLGDANWTAGDAAQPDAALLARNPALAMVTFFDGEAPRGAGTGEQQAFPLNAGSDFDGNQAFAFIQTLRDEPSDPLLDAVMLARLPQRQQPAKEQPVEAPGASDQPRPRLALLRSRKFLADPDSRHSHFQNWTVEAGDLPDGTQSFWVSGGHARPVYTVCASTPGGRALFRRASAGQPWVRLAVDVLLEGAQFGPVFANPYDPGILFALTTGGVRRSLDGGRSFQLDSVLTGLLTGSGQFPLTGSFTGGSSRDVVLASRANAMGTLSAMAFFREDPRVVVAASPFAGVFIADRPTGPWRSLSYLMPRPLAPVSALGIDQDSVYAATEGRGLLRIRGFRGAPLGTLFARDYSYVTLLDGAGDPVPAAPIEIRLLSASRRWLRESRRRTDSRGTIGLDGLHAPAGAVIALQFPGDARRSPARTAFLVA